MDPGGFLNTLADAVSWVIQHGQVLVGVLVALIIAAYLFTRRDSS
jgi:uncharacterized membrane-anchored protein